MLDLLHLALNLRSLRLTQQAHALSLTLNLLTTNPFLTSKLISSYSLLHLPSLSRQVFDSFHHPTNVLLFNSLLSAYCNNRVFAEPISLFAQMRAYATPDRYTLAIVAKASAELGDLLMGSSIHCLVLKHGFGADAVLSNSVMGLYLKCGEMGDAHKMFDEMPARSVASWNALVAEYARLGDGGNVFKVVGWMQKEGMMMDGFTICSVLPLCRAGTGGREIHCYVVRQNWGLESDVHVGSCLIKMYSTGKRVDLGRRVFDRMGFKNVVAWTAMINGYVENGEFEEALDLFREMQLGDGIFPNKVSLVSVLPGIGSLARLVEGKQVHAFAIRMELNREATLNNALIDMYSKCGRLDSAKRVFDDMSWCKDAISWGSMISCYGIHGKGKEAVNLFNKMCSLGVKLDHITSVSILSACGRAGLVSDGFKIYNSLMKDHGVVPTVEVCSCVVDMFGRAGQFSEALNFINSMSLPPGPSVWGALFNSSLIHNNQEMQALAYSSLIQLEPENPSNYVSLSNLHASSGRWDVVAKVRKRMKEEGLRKTPSCSWISVNSGVHSFSVADKSHHCSDMIYYVLDNLLWVMRGDGLISNDDNFT